LALLPETIACGAGGLYPSDLFGILVLNEGKRIEFLLAYINSVLNGEEYK
jgi:hypothetical protein